MITDSDRLMQILWERYDTGAYGDSFLLMSKATAESLRGEAPPPPQGVVGRLWDIPIVFDAALVNGRWRLIEPSTGVEIESGHLLAAELAPGLMAAELAPGLLTADERQAVYDAGQLWNLLCRIVRQGPTRAADLRELGGHIHAIQREVMSQAAARAYPGTYRLLGQSIHDYPDPDDRP